MSVFEMILIRSVHAQICRVISVAAGGSETGEGREKRYRVTRCALLVGACEDGDEGKRCWGLEEGLSSRGGVGKLVVFGSFFFHSGGDGIKR